MIHIHCLAECNFLLWHNEVGKLTAVSFLLTCTHTVLDHRSQYTFRKNCSWSAGCQKPIFCKPGHLHRKLLLQDPAIAMARTTSICSIVTANYCPICRPLLFDQMDWLLSGLLGFHFLDGSFSWNNFQFRAYYCLTKKGPLRAYLINLLFLTVIVVVKADAHFIAMDGENYTELT